MLPATQSELPQCSQEALLPPQLSTAYCFVLRSPVLNSIRNGKLHLNCSEGINSIMLSPQNINNYKANFSLKFFVEHGQKWQFLIKYAAAKPVCRQVVLQCFYTLHIYTTNFLQQQELSLMRKAEQQNMKVFPKITTQAYCNSLMLACYQNSCQEKNTFCTLECLILRQFVRVLLLWKVGQAQNLQLSRAEQYKESFSLYTAHRAEPVLHLPTTLSARGSIQCCSQLDPKNTEVLSAVGVGLRSSDTFQTRFAFPSHTLLQDAKLKPFTSEIVLHPSNPV